MNGRWAAVAVAIFVAACHAVAPYGPGPGASPDAGTPDVDAGQEPEASTVACSAGTSCDDQDPCTTGDRCVDGRCRGEDVICDAPPDSSCTDDGQTRVHYDPLGKCLAGACVYAEAIESCSYGCNAAVGECYPCVGHTDSFATLDPAYWGQWLGDNIELTVNQQGVHAGRDAQQTLQWNGGSGVLLKPRVDFTGNGSWVEWQVKFEADAEWNLTYAQLRDADAERYVAFDFSTADQSIPPVIWARLTYTYPQSHHWQYGGIYAARGDVVRFVISNPAPRTVRYQVHGANQPLDHTKTFTAAEWNGMDWVSVRWMAFGWPMDGTNTAGAPATIAATLLSVSTSCSTDTVPPTVQLAGPQPGIEYAGDPPIDYGAADAESGVRCVRAAWDDWPAGEGDCDEVSGTTSHPSTGDRTLHVRAWDWGGNRAERQELYRRAP